MDAPFPRMEVPDLGKLGKEFDITKLPPAFKGEFTAIGWDWQVEYDEDNPQLSIARFIFYIPMLPFIKFNIPFVLSDDRDTGLNKFRSDIDKVLEFFEGLKTSAETASDPAA